MKKIITAVLPFTLFMTALTSCGPKEIKVTSIEFTLEKSEAMIGEQVKIKDIKVLPENATDRGINWTLENPDAGEVHTMGEEPYVIGTSTAKTKVVATAIDGSGVTKAVDIEFINPKVTEEEFKKAISFQGISYAQAQISIDIGGEAKSILMEFSPNIYHQSPVDDEEKYCYKINESSYKELIRSSEGEDWKDVEWSDGEGSFPTPETILGGKDTSVVISIISMLNVYKCDYSKFSFDEESKLYIAKGKIGTSDNYDFSLEFKNGIVQSFSAKKFGDKSNNLTTTYSYNEEVPILPKPVSSSINNI